MSLNEKSALAMGLLSLAVLGWVASMIVPMLLAGTGWPAPGDLPLIRLSVLFIVIAIIIHIVLASLNAKDAERGEDERDRAVMYKAGAYTGSFFGFVTVWGLLHYATTGNGDAMFTICLTGLLAATAGNFILQVGLYRTAH